MKKKICKKTAILSAFACLLLFLSAALSSCIFETEPERVPLSGYRIVYSPDVTSVASNAERFSDIIYQFCGIKPELLLYADVTELPEDTLPVVIDRTGIQFADEFIDSLSDTSYGFSFTENGIVIAGKTPALTCLALRLFIDAVLKTPDHFSGGELIFRPGYTMTRSADPFFLTPAGILNSKDEVEAYITSLRQIPKQGDFTSGQGAATDGEYFYCILRNKTTDTDVIVKLSAQSDFSDALANMKVSGELDVSHGNDMCFDTRRNLLIVDDMNGSRLTVVDPETLEIVERITVSGLSGTIYGVAYCETRDSYVLRAGNKIYILDSQWHVLRSAPNNEDPSYVGQGMDCDENLIYIPQSRSADKGTSDDIIRVFDWDLNFVRTVHLPSDLECETIMNHGGHYYMYFTKKGGRIYDLGFSGLLDVTGFDNQG